MNKEGKYLLFEIFIMIFIFVFSIPIFINLSNDVNNRRNSYVRYSDKYSFNIVKNYSKEELDNIIDDFNISTLNDTGSILEYDVFLKINYIDNLCDYNVLIDDNKYNLCEISYIDNNNYLYFYLDTFMINHESNINIIFYSDGLVNNNLNYNFFMKNVR